MPTPSALHVDSALAGISTARARNAFVAPQIFPYFDVRKQSDVFYNSDPNQRRLALVDVVRAPGSPANLWDNEDPTTSSYLCQDYSLAAYIADEERDNADDAARLEINRTEFLTDILMNVIEVEVVALLQTLSSTSTPSTLWSAANATPIADVRARKETIAAAIGKQPNVLVTTQAVMDKVRTQAEFRDEVKHTRGPEALRANSTADLFAAACDLERVIIGESWKNTAIKGQTKSLSRIWGKHAFLLYVEPPSLQMQGIGATFRWTGASGGAGQDGAIVEIARAAPVSRKSDEIAVHHYIDPKIMNAGAGHYFNGVIA